ncbi:hypothetical protein C8J57DRAFT_1128876 [Mycena rebaudengoi]|nr:hypothetical protein C8J57DRAFT_1128876 [Mycena rebaudengoi]
MGWFSNLFSPPSQASRKGQAMNSTHDAFSLHPTHPDAFNPDSLNTPDMDAGPSYTYPPQGSPAYKYVPTSASSRHSSLLPTHHDALHSPNYPPLAVTWGRLRAWLAREYPELGDTLNYGILPIDLAQLESQFGFDLPPVVRESYLEVDGQEAESSAGCSEGLFFGLTLLPLEDVLDEWRFWREVDDDPSTGANAHLRTGMRSIPPGWVRKEYSQRGWIPLIADKAGNYIGVDVNPDEGGSIGQVIVFGRDFDSKVVLWAGDGPAGWAKWLACFVDELESGDGYEIGGGDNSEEDEDDLGFESYFYDGQGRGQGDGGGGDFASGGGLRLAGEYRGWNVLEAWADRSVRKWHEMGLIPVNEKTESKQPETEVLIPESSTPQQVPTLFVNGETAPAPAPVTVRPSLPTAIVTKPPAPLPVDLPTQSDISVPPSPTDSPRSSFRDVPEYDLESGMAMSMREVAPEPVARRQAANPTQNAQASGSSPAPAATAPPPAEIPDLLADSAPPMDATPIVPSSPSIAAPSIDIVSSAPPPADVDALEEPEVDPDVTIRLVGGGGIAGLVSDEVIDAEAEAAAAAAVAEESDTESVASAASVTSTSSIKKKTHKKTLSGLKGLKKLGGLGLRKKDSSASVGGKEKEPEPVPVPAS